MIFETFTPSNSLSKFVQSIDYINGNTKGVGFPKMAMSIVFNLKDGFRLYTDTKFNNYKKYNKYWIAGFQMKPSYVEGFGQSEMIVIQFKSLGALQFLKEPLNEFKNKYIAFDLINKKIAEETWDKLNNAKQVAEKFVIAENFLIELLEKNNCVKLHLVKSLNHLLSGGAHQSVRAMHQELNISRKHLNFLFNQYIGLSPKSFLKLKRFEKSLKLLSRNEIQNLTRLSTQIGFFDQAHFIKDFKVLTDLTPSDYLEIAKRTPSIAKIPHYIPYLK